MQKTPYNKHYKQDLKYIMLLIGNLLFALSIWPFSDRKRSICDRICRFLRIIISYLLLFCSLVPAIFSWMIEKRLSVRIKMTAILLYCCITCGKYGNLIIRQSQIRRCLQHIEEDWKKIAHANTRLVMLEYAKNSRRLIAITAVFFYSSGIALRAILPLAKGKIINEYNVTIRPLPFPTYLFSFNVYASPAYEVLYTIQFLCGIVTMSIAEVSCGLLIAFVMHACGQLKILMDLMKNFVEKKQESEVDEKLADIVEHQIRIRSFLQLVENTLHQICFIELSGITIVICVLGYCVITVCSFLHVNFNNVVIAKLKLTEMEWENSNSLAMCSYFFTFFTSVITVFTFCYIGEQLMTQAEKIATTACELEWYRLPDRKAREVVLVMIMSNMPLKITAGKVFDLSFKTFSNILKTAAAYFNMLRSVTE